MRIAFLVVVVLAAGCEEKVPASALTTCQGELTAARTELEEVKNGADRLLQQAQGLLARKDLDGAQRAAASLIEKHPGTPQAVAGSKLLAELEPQLSKARTEAARATAAQKAAEAKAVTEATMAMAAEEDKVKGITWYRHRESARFLNSRSDLLLYFAAKNGRAQTLRLLIQYVAEDWLFIKHLVVKADDRIIEMTPKMETDSGARAGGGVGIWEWVDVEVGSKDLELVRAVIAAKSVTIRYEGRQYTHDREVSPAERQRLQQTLAAYTAMGGELPSASR